MPQPAKTLPAPALPNGDDRPLLYYWLGARRISNVDAAAALDVHPQSLYRYMLPFADSNRQRPHDDVLERIVAYTDGDIAAPHFYPPHLRGVWDVARAAAKATIGDMLKAVPSRLGDDDVI